MAKRVNSIFIEDSAIKLLITQGKQVEKWVIYALEPGVVRNGEILDEEYVAARVRELCQQENVKGKKVIAGLSGLNSLYRLISLPELPSALLDEAVRNEARRVIPISLDEVYLAYQPIPASRGETRIFLAAFPRATADSLYRTLRLAGLEPYLMDLSPLALCRTINEPTAIIINVWSTNLDIVVMADRIPELTRSLSLPSEAVYLEEKLPSITEELTRVVTFYNSTHMEKPLSPDVPIFVCGELAHEPDSWQQMLGRLRYPVASLPSPVSNLEGFDASQFPVNIGLAFKELALEKEANNFSIVNFNTLPDIYRPKPRPLSQTLIPVGIAAGIALIVAGGFLIWITMSHTNDLRAQLNSIQSLINQNMDEVAVIGQQLQPIEAVAENLSTTLINLRRNREEVADDMTQIVSLMPGGADLTDVSYEGEIIYVGGVTEEEAYIFHYARALRSSGNFSTVLVSEITRQDDDEDKLEFYLTLTK